MQVQNIATQFGVSLAVAAMILVNQTNGQPLAEMAEGGHTHKGKPVLVGERGPEVFTPDVPGTIAPAARSTNAWTKPVAPAWPSADWHGYEPQPYGPRVNIKPAAWDRWLADLPESENIEDRR